MSVERRYVPADAGASVSIETRDDGQKTIVGHAAVFFIEGDASTEYRLFDTLIERIMPRAFNKALNEKHNAAALWNHNPDFILGRVKSKTLKLSKDQKGLRYEITPPAARADVVEAIERGDVTGSSFGFRVLDQKFKTETKDDETYDVREIHSVELLDVSPVVYPAYQGTTTGLRADGDAAEARTAYDQWKAADAALKAKLKGYLDRAAEVSQG